MIFKILSRIININSTETLTEKGQIRIRDSDGVLVYHNGSSEVSITAPTPSTNFVTGSYVGDGNNNRTIPHGGSGLYGMTFLWRDDDAGHPVLIHGRAATRYFKDGAGTQLLQDALSPVTTFGALEETSFRVGNSGGYNTIGDSYYFLIIKA